jgi:hypothetical protein
MKKNVYNNVQLLSENLLVTNPIKGMRHAHITKATTNKTKTTEINLHRIRIMKYTKRLRKHHIWVTVLVPSFVIAEAM